MQITRCQWRIGIPLFLLACATALAGGTNRPPVIESFESYSAGYSIASAPGWTAQEPDTAVVTTNAAALAALGDYLAAHAPPIVTTHEKVLAFTSPVRSQVRTEPGRGVVTDFLLRPTLRDRIPDASDGAQAGIVFDTNGVAAIYSRDMAAASNRWHILAGAPAVASGQWVRVTFRQDYVHHMYQVSLNGGLPLEDAAGWSGPGGTQQGSWFHMAQTNGYLSAVATEGTGSYLDDLSVVSELPGVANLGATNITAGAADLWGALSHTGFAAAGVEVYWGASDGGTNPASWAYSNFWAAPRTAGVYTCHATGMGFLMGFYRFAATNAYGRVWAERTDSLLVGSVVVTAPDPQAAEWPTDTGTFRIERPPDATNGSLSVNFTLQGTAQNGVDYQTVSSPAVIPDGSAYVDITVTPIRDALTEGAETVTMVLQPGVYALTVATQATINIADEPPPPPPGNLLWDNGSGDMNWNTNSANWFSELRFSPGDHVTFNAAGTGRIYVGTAAWNAGSGTWSATNPAAVDASLVTVKAGQFEFEGGAVAGGPVQIQGGRVIDRNLALRGFGTGPITLSGNGEFWRQIPPDTVSRSQVLTNDFVVTGPGVIEGGRGTNAWAGAVDLRARLNIGWTNVVTGHTNLLQGTVTVNQDTNYTGSRAVCLQAGGGAAFLDGLIADDTNATHTGHFPLTLGLAAGAANLVLRGSNTYACGTVVTNFGGTNAAVVAGAASSTGQGPVQVTGTGSRLSVQAARGVAGSLTVYSGAAAYLAADNAVAGVVSIQSGGLLVLQSGNCIPDDGVLQLATNGAVQTAGGLAETVGDLYIGGRRLYPRTYTSDDYPANILGYGAIRVRNGQPPPGCVLRVR